MSWLEVTLAVAEAQREQAETALEELGALSLTLRDADLDTPDEQAIFEPGVGETPMWRSLFIDALFSADRDRRQLVDAISRQLPWLTPAQLSLREVADQDWERAWMAHFRPMQFGQRLWVYPWSEEPEDVSDKVIIRLDPGLAFGTGTHPTTAMCLAWLDGANLAGKTVIDYGCGSGVLALAALKLGARHVIGIDNDPQALTASRDNAERNGVAGHLRLFLPEDAPTQAADVVVANILAGPLQELAPHMAALCRPGGELALSGILEEQAARLLDCYATWFDNLASHVEDGWVRISGARNHTAAE